MRRAFVEACYRWSRALTLPLQPLPTDPSTAEPWSPSNEIAVFVDDRLALDRKRDRSHRGRIDIDEANLPRAIRILTVERRCLHRYVDKRRKRTCRSQCCRGDGRTSIERGIDEDVVCRDWAPGCWRSFWRSRSMHPLSYRTSGFWVQARTRITLVGIVFMIGSGCASITSGQNQTLSVATPNCPQATCQLTNKDGVYYVSPTPGTVMVNRACAKLTVQCSKKGYDDGIIQVSSSIKTMAWGNIIFGGLIGVAVDGITGAACGYPSFVPVPMNCGTSTTVAATPLRGLSAAAEEASQAAKCADMAFVGEGPAGELVYSGVCEDKSVLMTCVDDGCSFSEFGQSLSDEQ